VLSPSLTTLRLFLHILAASVWVGGQIALAGVVPSVRKVAPEATKAVARAFARVAWPAFAVVVLTGIGEAGRRYVTAEFAALGTNTLVVLPGKVDTAGAGLAGMLVGETARDLTLGDAAAMTWRNLVRVRRNPQLIVFATIQPVIFVLMFRYVFGGAIRIPNVSYVDFLMAGVWVQTVTFGALNTGVGLAEDLQAGLIERFRSLPMARSAVLVGRTTADLVRNMFVVALMTVVGFLVGFSYHVTFVALLGGAVGEALVPTLDEPEQERRLAAR